ncbi:N-acetyl-gamma-glutamyl-phosphate reductase [Alphaproteobacteria bacterium]|nr:N-acetyl-gamma-glutamyl-phosphate reductase [Alphaproteobacteria bacterium]
MTWTVFIDGEEGTTGLQIRDRLKGRAEFELAHLPETRRKDPRARRKALNNADLVILCLPDDAAREAVEMVDNLNTRIIDTSTAHRVSDGWVYGFPEMTPDQKSLIEGAKRVTNPGCYPTGAIALILPLVCLGILPADYPVQVNAVSGYSGGGKLLIARIDATENPNPIESEFFVYGLGLRHKHVPEMQQYANLTHPPVFVPSVGRFRQGMIVQVPLQLWDLPGEPTVGYIRQVLCDYYKSCQFVTVANNAESEARSALLDPEGLNNTNHLRLYVFGNEDTRQVVLVAQLDNLGKGAAGQAVQNLNLMLGLVETAGLE